MKPSKNKKEKELHNFLREWRGQEPEKEEWQTTWKLLKDQPKGEYIKLAPTETAPVWIKGDYNRKNHTYSLTRVDDVNHECFRHAESLVYTGFTY